MFCFIIKKPPSAHNCLKRVGILQILHSDKYIVHAFEFILFKN